ncbi:Oidioi.mRNA.OKI2018_I69.PAR.g9090.t1.cds [Oikopleura dioica]|uniref:Oidioi.mRNA.OKI2018_I69.PAR.g9090.t1.cds n=1 Tax=Oikopleura dioica TaxID=34765 RepID=A0ABN7RN63_OIKDI|nr:Oidioi.mRNA.OKI2018_I69.PAR.g9090.t1.cds [Oikopleura dioica]
MARRIALLVQTIVSAAFPEFILVPEQQNYLLESQKSIDLQCVFQNADEISWKCNGRSVPDKSFSVSDEDGVVKSVLTVSRMDVLSFFGNDDYWCMCQIRDGKNSEQSGWVKSQRSFIVHSYLHNKFQKPLPQSGGVKFGEKFVLDCRPPAGNPKPLVSWLKDGEPIKIDGENYELTSQGDLIVNTVDKTAAGNYTCRASSVVGSRLSPPASVFVYTEPTWSDWSDWSACEVNNDSGCGSGYQKQTRSCSNPLPMYDGVKCRGPAKRLEKCFVMCPNARGNSFKSIAASDPLENNHDEESGDLVVVASVTGAACLLFLLVVAGALFVKNRRKFDYFKHNPHKGAQFTANQDFDIIRVPTHAPEYSALTSRKDGHFETIENLLYRSECSKKTTLTDLGSNGSSNSDGVYHHVPTFPAKGPAGQNATSYQPVPQQTSPNSPYHPVAPNQRPASPLMQPPVYQYVNPYSYSYNPNPHTSR